MTHDDDSPPSELEDCLRELAAAGIDAGWAGTDDDPHLHVPWSGDPDDLASIHAITDNYRAEVWHGTRRRLSLWECFEGFVEVHLGHS